MDANVINVSLPTYDIMVSSVDHVSVHAIVVHIRIP